MPTTIHIELAGFTDRLIDARRRKIPPKTAFNSVGLPTPIFAEDRKVEPLKHLGLRFQMEGHAELLRHEDLRTPRNPEHSIWLGPSFGAVGCFSFLNSGDNLLMMNKRIHLSPPHVTEAEENAIVRAIRSGWIAPLGPEVDAFEKELAERCGRAHAVALASGTAALHLGLLNLDVRPGDAVITASMTFAATANAITYVDARPVFVDCDETGNMDPVLLDIAIRDQIRQGSRVAAVIPVDLLGKVADYDSITAIADSHGIPILSDAAESLGATNAGRPAGSFGEFAAVSFNGNKIITTSGGGALLTNDASAADRTRYLATQARQPMLHYEHVEVGYNYRMSNLLAALGRAQLARLTDMMAKRRDIRSRYRALFAGVEGVTMFGQPDGAGGGDTTDNFWLTSILVDQRQSGWHRDKLITSLGAHDIEARPLWKPMHLQPVYADSPHYLADPPMSDRLFNLGISLPSGSVLGEEEWTRIEYAVQLFLEGARP